MSADRTTVVLATADEQVDVERTTVVANIGGVGWPVATGGVGQDAIDDLQAAIDSEATARAAGDDALDLAVTAEEAARIAAVSAEAAARSAEIAQAVSDLLGGAPPASLDTLADLAAQLGNDASAIAALTTGLAGKETPAGAQAKVDVERDRAVAAEAAEASARAAADLLLVPKSTATASDRLWVSTGSGTVSELAIGASRFPARLAAGNLKACTPAEVKAELAIAAGDVSGLGGAATLSVGTTAGTVAAGDHTHDNVGTFAVPILAAVASPSAPMTNQGTWAATMSAAPYLSNGAAINDGRTWDFIRGSGGTYTLTSWHWAYASGGILTFYLDGTSLGTVDTYAGSTNSSASAVIATGVTISSGFHTFGWKITSKSSGAYSARVYAPVFTRTA